MTPEQMAALHARAFAGGGRAWTASEFATLLGSPHVFAVGDACAFALGRVAADEAELLTIATDPAHRRAGLGRRALCAFERRARQRGAALAHLEVAADNRPALALYAAAGFAETGRRTGYYLRGAGRVDAVLMRKFLSSRPRC